MTTPLRRVGPPTMRSRNRSPAQTGSRKYQRKSPMTLHQTGFDTVSSGGRPSASKNAINPKARAMHNAMRSTKIITALLIASLYGASSASAQQLVTPVPAACGAPTQPAANGSAANASGTYGNSSVTLFPAPSQGVARTGMFVQCLTTSCQFALNLGGGTASLTTAGNLVMNGAYAYFNSASLGWTPQGKITIIAAGSSVISAFACPM